MGYLWGLGPKIEFWLLEADFEFSNQSSVNMLTTSVQSSFNLALASALGVRHIRAFLAQNPIFGPGDPCSVPCTIFRKKLYGNVFAGVSRLNKKLDIRPMSCGKIF
jgi:hypothetical protein